MIEVENSPESQRFVITEDGRRVGQLDYEVRGDAFVVYHTEIDPAFGGRGLGGVLVKQALDYVRDAGLRLVPQCSFVAHYVDEHPSYAALLSAPSAGASGEGAS